MKTPTFDFCAFIISSLTAALFTNVGNYGPACFFGLLSIYCGLCAALVYVAREQREVLENKK